MGPIGDYDQLLAQTREALQQARSAPSVDDAEPAPPPRAVGVCAGGEVEATMVGQHLERVTIDPRALRLGTEALGEYIVDAVNAALDDMRSQAAASSDALTVDPAELARSLDDLQSQSIRSMSAISQALSDAVLRIQQSGR